MYRGVVISLLYLKLLHILDTGKVYAPGAPSKLGAILQRITNLTEVRLLNKSVVS
jgi:hypothetical protein